MASKKTRGALIDISMNPRDNKNFRLVSELQARADSLYRSVPHAMAQRLHSELLAGIPNKGPYKGLSDNLEVAEISIFRKGVRGRGGYSVHIPTKSRKVKKTDASRTVIYIRAKKMRGATDPAVQALEDMGPWTMDTIPFWPTGKAQISQRKVSVREAKKVSLKQGKQRGKVRREMEKAGKRIPAKNKLKVSSKNKAVPDVAMAALDLEFGSDGKRGKPIWRQSINAAKSTWVGKIAKDRAIKRTWFDGNTKSWKIKPTVKRTIGASTASKYVGFQKRLG